MTNSTIRSCRLALERAASCTEQVNEDASNLKNLLKLSDEELSQTVTMEDIVNAWLVIPAFERKAA